MRDKDQIKFQGEWNKLQRNVSTLVLDMKDVKKRLDYLQKENDQMRAEIDELRRNAADEVK